MRILLVNDDGIEGVGLIAMVKELYGKHDITVVAPKHECSGNSHALNFRTPIVVTKQLFPVMRMFRRGMWMEALPTAPVLP